MQLTRFTDLGLRALMLLAAASDDGRRVTTRSIATNVHASEHHVAKAVTQLAELGLVESQRGRGGGLSLTAQGRTATVGQVVRRLEGDADVVDCVGTRPCPLLPACRLRRALADAKEAFYRELDGHTIGDLTDNAVLPLISSLPLLPGTAGR
ncbi:Rrf2 family transcriptional regulator [Rhodococcus sp. BP-252]|uniref:Transcriptional regulator n=1 Tax=Rhodococcoides kyotonense TaxID=398843 RepID=A0A177YH64_9NOCA|nr:MULTISPECIES: Rrf2 family transcriptional regulator [Rhodococcus]MBY6414848.1 Rrf2 family transcriptional regulator [Rhodococcus sp. BP-320]MBY6419767.1 Rrf2 family transcriptional regulator [Rhodococcus sp. BP-321]MBY6423160.1 Rrf2 family transcriptional regulator [Rhodococcus sp. BP-324]MBY6429726.1 Rrf2 family transcriptional regulator [Rhodococcus sp. BP-323]MBY6434698.1 Rrf2 family transcriptional regulator [Rhodococcus sp. BP-322]